MSTQIPVISYSQLKSIGNITGISLGSDGDTITVTSKQFDSTTGMALADLVTMWSLKDINNQIAEINSQTANFNQVISDANANKATL